MTMHVDRLLSISSDPIASCLPKRVQLLRGFDSTILDELYQMLAKRNGFYAFESALHVFPAASGSGVDLARWNSNAAWRNCYSASIRDCLFFAEDVFGGQFCLREESVCTFDPETETVEILADSVEEWARLVLLDHRNLTGFALAHEWQDQNGPIPPGSRLVPKIPFVLGGEFSTENLCLMDSTQGMRLRGEIAQQIGELPDGSEVMIHIKE